MIPRVDASDDDWDRFLVERLTEWRRHVNAGNPPCGMLEFLGMTDEEYVDWVTRGVIAERVRHRW